MRTLTVSILITLSSAVLGQRIPTAFADATYERLSDSVIVFQENSENLYSRIIAIEAAETKKFKRHSLVAETRFIEGIKVVTVVDLKASRNPLMFKYSHFVGISSELMGGSTKVPRIR